MLRALMITTAIAVCVPVAIASQHTANVDAVGRAQRPQLPPISEIHATRGIASIYILPIRFKKIIVGDASVADVAPLDDRSIQVEAHRTGMTNLILLDEDNRPAYELALVVDAPTGIVTMHNKANINSSMSFQCWETGCEYVGETTVAEPTPLPHGWSNQTLIQGNIQGTAPAPIQVTPEQQ